MSRAPWRHDCAKRPARRLHSLFDRVAISPSVGWTWFRRNLASIDPVAKEAGKDHEDGASHLEFPGPLHRNPRHHPQPLLRCAEANQALDEEAPAHQRQDDRYPRPYVMKPDDDASQWQIQKPVREGAGFPLAS